MTTPYKNGVLTTVSIVILNINYSVRSVKQTFLLYSDRFHCIVMKGRGLVGSTVTNVTLNISFNASFKGNRFPVLCISHCSNMIICCVPAIYNVIG